MGFTQSRRTLSFSEVHPVFYPKTHAIVRKSFHHDSQYGIAVTFVTIRCTPQRRISDGLETAFREWRGMVMRIKRFLLLILLVMLFTPNGASAQNPTVVRFSYSPSLFDDRDFAYNLIFGSRDESIEPDIMTKYFPMQSGSHTGYTLVGGQPSGDVRGCYPHK